MAHPSDGVVGRDADSGGPEKRDNLLAREDWPEHFTDKQVAFLNVYSRTGHFCNSCKAVEISPMQPSRWRGRDDAFEESYQKARRAIGALWEDRARERAWDNEKPADGIILRALQNYAGPGWAAKSKQEIEHSGSVQIQKVIHSSPEEGEED